MYLKKHRFHCFNEFFKLFYEKDTNRRWREWKELRIGIELNIIFHFNLLHADCN